MDLPSIPANLDNRSFWFKVVGFLEQNWAVISEKDGQAEIWFFGDTNGVFDTIVLSDEQAAEEALRRNGFSLLAEDEQAQEFIARPSERFRWSAHPSGRIYSSGRYWF